MEETPTGKPKYTFWISSETVTKNDEFYINWFAFSLFILSLRLCLCLWFCLCPCFWWWHWWWCFVINSPAHHSLYLKVSSCERCALSLSLGFGLSLFLALALSLSLRMTLMMMFCDKLPSPTLYLKVNSFERCAQISIEKGSHLSQIILFNWTIWIPLQLTLEDTWKLTLCQLLSW